MNGKNKQAGLERGKIVKRWGNTAVAGEGKHRDPRGSSYKLPRPLLTFCLRHSQPFFFFFFHVNASFTWTPPYTQDGHVQWGRHPVFILIVLAICLVSFASPPIGTVSHCKYELMAPYFKVLWEVDILTWLNKSARIWKYSRSRKGTALRWFPVTVPKSKQPKSGEDVRFEPKTVTQF